MEITQVKIHKIDREDSKLKAYVNVTLDDSFAVHNIRLFNRPSINLIRFNTL